MLKGPDATEFTGDKKAFVEDIRLRKDLFFLIITFFSQLIGAVFLCSLVVRTLDKSINHIKKYQKLLLYFCRVIYPNTLKISLLINRFFSFFILYSYFDSFIHRQALYASKIVSYAQGFMLLRQVSAL